MTCCLDTCFLKISVAFSYLEIRSSAGLLGAQRRVLIALRDRRCVQIEPGVGGFDEALSANEAWAGLVAACARIGVRLGMLMPMATIAIDSELIPAQPELVYWWRAGLEERLMGTPTGDQRLAPEAVPAHEALQRFVVVKFFRTVQ